MKPNSTLRKRGFTLLETVIAIGVLAVLLTGFMIVFAPAAAGIRKSINVQEADRLTSALEQELVTLRDGQKKTGINTGFDKAFFAIKDSTGALTGKPESGDSDKAVLVYQYRGSLTSSRSDGTPDEVTEIRGKVPGRDYVVQSMMRTRDDPLFLKDIKALEGSVYMVKCVQLVFANNGLEPATEAGKIFNPKPKVGEDPNYKPGPFDKPDDYPEAVIAFTADFYSLPSRAESFFTSPGFAKAYKSTKSPVFSRNLAVRR